MSRGTASISQVVARIDKVAGEFRNQMTFDIENLRRTLASRRKLVTERKDYQVEFNKKLDAIGREICNRAETLKRLIDTETDNLLIELSTIRSERYKQMHLVVGEIEQNVSLVESMVTYTEQLRDKGKASDVAQQTNALHIRAGKLMKLDVIHQASNNFDSDDVTFTPATWPTQSRGSKVVGEMEKKLSHGKLLTYH